VIKKILTFVILVVMSSLIYPQINSKLLQNVNKPTTITAQKVIDKYLEAIGGRRNFLMIFDRSIYMSGTVQGIKIKMTVLQKSPDKYLQLVDFGSSTQKVIFNGKHGFLVVGDEVQKIKGTDLEKLKFESSYKLIAELKTYNVKAKFDSVVNLDGKKTYEIELVMPNGNIWRQFYDANTNLKVKEIKPVESPTDTLYQNIFYSNYKKVDGIKYPFYVKQTLGSQIFEFKVDSLKINIGLTDRNFEVGK
jgi:zinc protease